MKSLITDIQKYSIHDGDGIRTTVFFKGCGLKCLWCHNPETQSYKKELLHSEEQCRGCGSCLAVCPNEAIFMRAGKAATDRAKCMACGVCVRECCLNLREVAGKEYTVDQLLKELHKDEMFYEESGGGVTLSGGEVMTADMDFVGRLVKKLHYFGISVTIDTCGQAPYENYERILPFVDTFLYDIKTIDTNKHRQYMGTGNEVILKNLQKLSSAGARLYIRIPVIKEVNGDERSIKEIIAYLLLHRIHTQRVNLLPYHHTGSGKYARIGKCYEGCHLHTPTKEELNHFMELFQKAGFQDVRIGG